MFTLTIIFRNRQRYDMGRHASWTAAFDAAAVLCLLDENISDYTITRARKEA